MRIFFNANIYTLDGIKPNATAIAIDRGRILFIGDDEQILREFEGASKSVNLRGLTVIPGLTDAHIHFQQYALGLQKIDCETPTKAECLQRVADRVKGTSSGNWILGHGWNQNNWPQGFGSLADLDAISTHHPIYLTAKSLHAGWANSAALHVAGITRNTPDPPDGQIQRDQSGDPTGVVFEGAMALLSGAIPEPADPAIANALLEAQSNLWKMGLTGIHDFDRRDCFAALQMLHAEEKLGLRVIKNIPLDDLPHAAALGLRSGFGDEWLRIGGIKAFADGALGPHTAAMFQPYENDPDNKGILFLDAEEIFEHGQLAVRNGLGMSIHAIGDRANHEVLNAYEQLRTFEKENNLPAFRHRIEHVQLLHPNDVARLGRLGIIASMQPIHATSDMHMADQYWRERSAFSYAPRTQLENGAVVAFGSDAPVESPNPFWGLHAAVTRQRADGSPGPDGWYPEQKLTVLEALLGFTQGPAYAAGMDNVFGKLHPGYFADLLVIDQDPFECHPSELRNISPIATMVNGEWVYGELNL